MIGHRRALRSKAEMTVVNRIRRWSSLMKASHARTTVHFEILEWSDTEPWSRGPDNHNSPVNKYVTAFNVPVRIWPPEERPLERLITAKAWQREAKEYASTVANKPTMRALNCKTLWISCQIYFYVRKIFSFIFFLYIIICRMEMIPDEYFLTQRWKYILRIIFDSKVHEEKIIYQILIYIKTFLKIEDTCISVGRKIEQLLPLILGNKYMN